MQRVRRPATPLGGLAVLGVALLFSLLSCGREITGPGGARVAHGLSFVAHFPGPLADVAEGAGSIVEFDRVRVHLERRDGSSALDRTFPFRSDLDELPLNLSVTLSPDAPAGGEPLNLRLFYINPAGDTVFAGGPVSVLAVPARGGNPPAPAQVPLRYTGPGSEATAVAVAPDTLTVVAGDAFSFSAEPRDSAGSAVPAAPILWSVVDTAQLTLADVRTGAGTTRATRGLARVRATLAAGNASALGHLVILPRPATLELVSGGGQVGAAESLLAAPVIVRLVATDGLGIGNAEVQIAVGGGGLIPDSVVVTDSAGVAEIPWRLGEAGAQSLTLSSQGVADLSVAATITADEQVATQLVIVQQPGPIQSADVALTPALVVEARDANGQVVPTFDGSVTVTLGEAPDEAIIAGTLTVTAVNGVASFDNILLDVFGSYRLEVQSDGFPALLTEPFTVVPPGANVLSVVSGDGQTAFNGEPVPAPIRVRLADAEDAPIIGATVTFTVAAGGGSLTGATPTTDSLGIATLGSWTLGATAGANSLSVSADGAEPITISATAEDPPPAIVLSVFGSNVIGVERAGQLVVRLLQPAPTGGLTVTVVSDSTQFLTVTGGGTLAFAVGETQRTIGVSGLALGTAVVRATAPGYAPDTLAVPVSLNLISLPPTLNVPVEQTRSLPVQITTPAPAGGVAIALASANPAIARPVADTVLIPAGALTVNAIIEGEALGSTTITATNPNYAVDVTTVNVAAELNITATTLALNGSFGTAMTVRLESGGTPVAAPSNGVPLTLTTDEPACAAVAPNATIGAGLVSVVLDVTYGGSAPLPCSTRVRVAGPDGFSVDSATVNVAAVPGISRGDSPVGSGLQRNLGATLGASNHGGITVRVTSLDSSLVLVSPATGTPGSGSYEVNVLPNATSIPLVVSGIEGRIADTALVRIEAPNFVTQEFRVFVWQPVYQLTSLTATMNTLSTDNVFYASIGTPSSPTGTSIWVSDPVRAGAPPLPVTIVNDSTAVGTLVQTAGTLDSATVFVNPGSTNSATSVANGGVAFRASSAGVARIRASIPSFRALAGAVGTVTVSQPTISLSTDYVGSGLQRQRSVSTPSAPAPAGGTDITIRTSRPGVVLLAPDDATVGADSVIVTIPQGQTSATFWTQGLDDIVADTVQLTATATGYASATAEQRVWRAVYQLSNVGTGGTPFTADRNFYVSIGTPSSPTGTSIWVSDRRRAGAAPLQVSVVSDTPSVAALVQSDGIVRDSVGMAINPGSVNTPTTVANGGVALRYLSNGVSRIRAFIPGVGNRALAGAEANITVTSTSLSLSTDYVGSGFQRQRTVSVSAPAPAGGVPVTITADRLGVAQFAPNATTVGADTIVVTIPQGSSSTTFFVQGVEGILADTVMLTASSPGVVSGTAQQRVWQGVMDVSGLSTSYNSLAPDDPFQVTLGTPSSPTGTSIWVGDNLRFGSPARTATIVSSVPTVGQLTTTARTGDTVTVVIPSGGRVSPTTVAAGGVAFQTLTTGSTTITAQIPDMRPVGGALGQTVTISAPTISVGTPANLGWGLQTLSSGILSAAQHGGVNVVVRSSNPSLFRVARLASDVAADSIVIPVANGVTSFNYYVAAQDSVTGQASISAAAAGFVDGSATVTVVTPAIQLASVATTLPAFATDNSFIAQIGVPVANGTTLSSAQARRAGAAPLPVTFAVSNGGVGTLVTSGAVADTVTISINAGATGSPSTVAAGGVAFRALNPGSTTIRLTSSAVASTTSSSLSTVTVTMPVITLNNIANVGAGLQVNASGSVNAAQHGGVDIVIRSSDPSRIRLARTATDVAADSIVVPLANGSTSFSYVVAGVEGAVGEATVTASIPGFTTASRPVNVVTPSVTLSVVPPTATVGANDRVFRVNVGIPNAGLTGISTQNVRAGGPLLVTVTSSEGAVGTLVTSATPDGAATAQVGILPGVTISPTTVAGGGIAFRYVGAGSTTLTASVPGFVPVTAGSATVTVNAP